MFTWPGMHGSEVVGGCVSWYQVEVQPVTGFVWFVCVCMFEGLCVCVRARACVCQCVYCICVIV